MKQIVYDKIKNRGFKLLYNNDFVIYTSDNRWVLFYIGKMGLKLFGSVGANYLDVDNYRCMKINEECDVV